MSIGCTLMLFIWVACDTKVGIIIFSTLYGYVYLLILFTPVYSRMSVASQIFQRRFRITMFLDCGYVDTGSKQDRR